MGAQSTLNLEGLRQKSLQRKKQASNGVRAIEECEVETRYIVSRLKYFGAIVILHEIW